MIIRDIKKWCRQHSTDNLPHHWLHDYLLFVLKQDKMFLITHDDYHLSEKEWALFDDGIKQMQQGTPLAYLIGEQEFWGRVFKVNHHTLIPRPDTERLVEVVLSFIKNKGINTGRILDLGTGSGCIAISLAKELPNFEVVAVDYSFGAVETAKDNAKNLQANNCTVIQSDWFDKVDGVFDVIVSNPPYIDKSDEHLKRLIAEPITALVAEDEGLSDIKVIVKNAKYHLKEEGMLAIEHGYNQANKVREIFLDNGFCEVMTVKDYGGNDRLTMGLLSL